MYALRHNVRTKQWPVFYRLVRPRNNSCYHFEIQCSPFPRFYFSVKHEWLFFVKNMVCKLITRGSQVWSTTSSVMWRHMHSVAILVHSKRIIRMIKHFGYFFRRVSLWTKLATECICRHMTEEKVDQIWGPPRNNRTWETSPWWWFLLFSSNLMQVTSSIFAMA